MEAFVITIKSEVSPFTVLNTDKNLTSRMNRRIKVTNLARKQMGENRN
jgi:hypothetical protein